MADAIMVHNLDVHQLQEVIISTLKEQLNDVFEALKREKNETLLTREETYKLLKINSTTLWYWTKAGKLKCYGIANRRYYKKSEILECLTLLKS
ncbi:helix-turn-helix domain-containing protein [Flavobacterium sp. N3904]|uniref:helix-turn-helix domain-containing protein n=1 Tax=Flavobacterium sp. N3904 TaxID=2986835 RepID=UPI002225A1EF|nr:helix-turn-helix domain-containing protein [Flavobacterium sp. N3904]